MSEILLKEFQETCKAKKVYITSDVFSFSSGQGSVALYRDESPRDFSPWIV